MMFGSYKCPKCDSKVDKSSVFCSQCNFSLEDYRKAIAKGNVWLAREDELAARIHGSDLQGSVLTVMPGTKAMIFDEGNASIVESGEYPLDSFWAKLNRFGKSRDVSMVIMKDTEVVMDLAVPDGVVTKEFLEVDLQLSLSLRIEEPDRFVRNFMGDRDVYTLVHLRKDILPVIRQVAKEYFCGRSIKDIVPNRETLRQQINHAVDQALERSFTRYGLRFARVETLAIGHTQYDENNQVRARAWIDVDLDRAGLEKRILTDELYTDQELQALSQMEVDLGLQKKRRDLEYEGEENKFSDRLRKIDLYEKMTHADGREAVIRIGGEQALKDLEHETFKKELDRTEEETSWKHLQALAGLKRDEELSLARIDQEKEIARSRVEMQHVLEFERLQNEIELAIRVESEENRRHRQQLEEDAFKAGRQREETIKDAQLALEISSLDVKKRKVEDDYQLDFDRKSKILELEISAQSIDLERTKKAHEREHMAGLVDLDDRLAEQEKKRTEAARDHERKMQQEKDQFELERTRLRGELGVIADASPENAKEVAEAAKAIHGKSDQSAMSEEERIRLEQREQLAKLEAKEMLNRQEKSQQEQNAHVEKLIGMMTDGRSQSSGQPNVVVVPGTGAPQTVSGGETKPETRVKVCTSCGADNATSQRFCGSCGHAL